jgi:hypothetical protein
MAQTGMEKRYSSHNIFRKGKISTYRFPEGKVWEKCLLEDREADGRSNYDTCFENKWCGLQLYGADLDSLILWRDFVLTALYLRVLLL